MFCALTLNTNGAQTESVLRFHDLGTFSMYYDFDIEVDKSPKGVILGGKL